jgi:hypothetical protein
MEILLKLTGTRDVIAGWIFDMTRILEQQHRHDPWSPYTPGPEEGWDHEKNAYTGLVRVQIGVAPTEDLAPNADPRRRESVFEDQEIIRFELSQLAPKTVALRIIYIEKQEKRYDALMRSCMQQYVRQISEAWPEVCVKLQEQLHSFDDPTLAGLLDLAHTQNPWNRIPDHGYDRELVQNLHDGLSAAESARELNKSGYQVTDKTVRNRESRLRGQYGEDIVPKRR